MQQFDKRVLEYPLGNNARFSCFTGLFTKNDSQQVIGIQGFNWFGRRFHTPVR